MRIGFLPGEHPWHQPPKRGGPLLSGGVVARNLSRSLSVRSEIIPAFDEDFENPEAIHSFLSGVDVISGDAYPGRMEQALAARSRFDLSCRAVVCAMGTAPKAFEAMLFPWRELLCPGDHLLFTCEADRKIWRSLVSESHLYEAVLPLPVDQEIFYPRAEASTLDFRRRWSISENAKLLLYVGRINVQKNLHSIIRILPEIRQEFPDTHLMIVGKEDGIQFGEFDLSNEGYECQLRDYARELGVEDYITWAGPLHGEDLALAYSSAEILVNLSLYHRENFGLALAEAMSSGTPVVCSDWGGFRDIVEHGATGFRVPTTIDERAARVSLRHAVTGISNLLADSKKRASFASAAHRWAKDNLSVESLVAPYEALLKPERNGSRGPAYQPNEFAARYQARKVDCGWYLPGRVELGYPPLFQGRQAELYVQMMAPYATQIRDTSFQGGGIMPMGSEEHSFGKPLRSR